MQEIRSRIHRTIENFPYSGKHGEWQLLLNRYVSTANSDHYKLQKYPYVLIFPFFKAALAQVQLRSVFACLGRFSNFATIQFSPVWSWSVKLSPNAAFWSCSISLVYSNISRLKNESIAEGSEYVNSQTKFLKFLFFDVRPQN